MVDKDIKLSIAIVDDCKEDHILIKMALKEFKNIVFSDFYNGEDFLHFLEGENILSQTKHPNIVILDVNMPKMTGFQVFDLIDRKNLRDHMRFFILTTSVTEMEWSNCRKHKLKCFQKPFNINDFRELLEEMIMEAKP
jgi:response regulator RpfG family c-di-GMP phosphodiesterase